MSVAPSRLPRWSVASLLLWLCLVSLGHAADSPLLPVMHGRVNDLTQTLDDPTRQRLERKIADLETRKGAQIAVLILPTTGEMSIEDYANQQFRTWKLGRKDANDGVLVVVAKNDHKMRIEVGYGLEGTITDLLASQIIRERMTPAFREGHFDQGIEQAVDALILLVDGETLPESAPWQMPMQAYGVLIAFILGAVLGVLAFARKLTWRWTLGLALLTTAILVAATGGHEWPAQLLVVPLCLLVGGATFGALWMARTAFYVVLGLIVYIAVMVVVSRSLGSAVLIYGLAWPAGVLLFVGLWFGMFLLMRSTWRKSPLSFWIRLLIAVAITLISGQAANGLNHLQTWLVMLPGLWILLLILFSIGKGSGFSVGTSSGGSSRSSSGSSSSSTGGGGSSGGGGASGSW